MRAEKHRQLFFYVSWRFPDIAFGLLRREFRREGNKPLLLNRTPQRAHQI